MTPHPPALNSNNTSGYAGVTWHTQTNNWNAYVVYKRQRHNVGNFPTPQEASKARDRKIKELLHDELYAA